MPRVVSPFLTAGFLCVVPLFAQKPEVTKGKAQPTELIEQPWVFGTDVIKHWRDLPIQVNAPVNRTRVGSGQHLTVAVGARGDQRDQLLKTGTYSFTVTIGSNTQTFKDLHPTQVRQIKAEGADFVLSVLKAAKPVRTIAGALEWRKEGQAFHTLRKSGQKAGGVTIELAKGVSYMAAGWSLGSFYRNHPLVTDYIEAWKKDAGVPQVVREELGTLMTNEAFKRD